MSTKQFSSDLKLKAVKYYKKINNFVKYLKLKYVID
jgi:hypothetical protein